MNAAEFDAHVRAVRPTLLAYAYRYTRSHDDAEDITAETVAHAFVSIERYESASDLARDLRLICRDRIRAHFLMERHRRQFSQSLDAMVVDQQADNIAETDMLAAAQAKVRLAYMPPRTSQVFHLWLETDPSRGSTSINKVAVVLRIQPSTVRRHLAIAQQRLQEVEVLDAYPESFQQFFRHLSWVPRYFPPEKTGAGLAREKLRRMK